MLTFINNLRADLEEALGGAPAGPGRRARVLRQAHTLAVAFFVSASTAAAARATAVPSKNFGFCVPLWLKHLRPVWKSDMADMKSAVIACYAEAQELGVLRGKGTARDMVRFVL